MPTVHEIMSMSPEEIQALNKKQTRRLARNIALSIGMAVAVEILVRYLDSKIENAD